MGERLRVLIVDDSENDSILLLRELRNGGFDPEFERVDSADGMRAALDRQDWDIIVCDYLMPGFSGPDALKLMQEKGIDLPFIVVSGQIGENAAVEMMRAGAHDYIMKDKLARLIPAVQRELRETEVRRGRREADEALRRAHAELEMRVKQRTAELEKANAALLDLQRARDDLVNIVSHDLRNPLQVIQGQAQVIQRFPEQAHVARKGLDAINTSAKRMNAMIQDLVDSTRLEGGQLRLEKRPVGLPQFVSELLARMVGVIDVGRIKLQIPPDLPDVDADPDRLERILLNLLTNALKYSSADCDVTVVASSEDSTVRVSVADHGQGIPREDQARIFERFYRASRPKAEGMGLGLHITKMLVEIHGGRIWFESETGQGTTFHFLLPIAHHSRKGKSPRPHARQPSSP